MHREGREASFSEEPSPETISEVGPGYIPSDPGEVAELPHQEVETPPEPSQPEIVEYQPTGEVLQAQIENLKRHRLEVETYLNRLDSSDQTSEQRKFLEQELGKLDEELSPMLRQVAGEIIAKVRQGERISETERLFLVEDLTSLAECSALAESFLSRNGFKTFQEAMDRLGVKSVRVEDIVVQVEEDKEKSWVQKFLGKSWVKEHAKKLGISAGISTATVGALSLLGGPIGWLGLLGGLTGGSLARLGVERWRYAKLGQDNLGEKVAEDLLRSIYDLQNKGRTVLEQGTGADERAATLAEILEGINQSEASSLHQYHDLERKANKLKAIWGTVGSIGGAIAGSVLSHGTELSHLTNKAADQGVQIDLDGNGYAHQVMQTNDGAWRFVVEARDIEVAQNKLGQHLGDWLTVVTRESAGTTAYPVDSLQEFLQAGQPLFHIEKLQHSDIVAALSQQLWVKTGAVIAAVSGAGAAAEMGYFLHGRQKYSAERLRAHDKPLIDYFEAEAVRLRKSIKGSENDTESNHTTEDGSNKDETQGEKNSTENKDSLTEKKVPVKVQTSAERLLPLYREEISRDVVSEELADKPIDRESAHAFRLLYGDLVESWKQLNREQKESTGLTFSGVAFSDRHSFKQIRMFDRQGKRQQTFYVTLSSNNEYQVSMKEGTTIRDGITQKDALEFFQEVQLRLGGRRESSQKPIVGNEQFPPQDRLEIVQPSETPVKRQQVARDRQEEQAVPKTHTPKRPNEQTQREVEAELAAVGEAQGETVTDSRENEPKHEMPVTPPEQARPSADLVKFFENSGIENPESLVGKTKEVSLQDPNGNGIITQIKRAFNLPEGMGKITLIVDSIRPQINSDNQIHNYTISFSAENIPGKIVEIPLKSINKF